MKSFLSLVAWNKMPKPDLTGMCYDIKVWVSLFVQEMFCIRDIEGSQEFSWAIGSVK